MCQREHPGLRNAILAVCLCITQVALSAEFKKSPIEAGGPDLIEVVGDLIPGDEKKFIDVAIASNNAIVVFHSPGGAYFREFRLGTQFG